MDVLDAWCFSGKSIQTKDELLANEGKEFLERKEVKEILSNFDSYFSKWWFGRGFKAYKKK